jgi:hypothetical protein
MGGGLLQLVAYGAQDAYITGNPHITFWKVMYKRHTNFAMEAMRVNFTGTAQYGQRVVAIVNRNADLIYRTYLEVTLPDTTAVATGNTKDVYWTPGGMRRLGFLLLEKVEVEIGGQIIDRHYGEWWYLWECLTASMNQVSKADQLLGGPVGGTRTTLTICNGRPQVLYIPFGFWFNRNPGLALPLIALQYHDVHFNVWFRKATDLVTTYNTWDSTANPPSNTGGANWPSISAAASALPPPKDAAIYIDYIYLDTDERRRFAQDSHEYLIEQLQYSLPQTVTSAQARLDLTLNHPIKELVWLFQDARRLDCSLPSGLPNDFYSANPIGQNSQGAPGASLGGYTQPFAYDDIVNRCRIQLNGQDRFDERFGDYFWKVQPYQHHTGGAMPLLNAFVTEDNTVGERDKLVQGAVNPINVYSFALQPEEHQPSGTCNFSRIDTATLVFDSVKAGGTSGFPSKSTPFVFRLYAINYNVFRVMSGMGGLAYSN